MFLVIRKTSIKRVIALSVLLIVVGYTLTLPSQANASTGQIIYLYPYLNNNPVQTAGLFWWESHPELGGYTMAQWEQLLGTQLKVIGLPDNYILAKNFQDGMLGNNIGNWVIYKLRKKIQDRMKPEQTAQSPKENNDPFVYKRSVGKTSEEIRIPKKLIDDHFRDNDNFDKFMDTVRKHLTDNSLIREVNKKTVRRPKKEVPTPSPNDELKVPEQPKQDQQLHTVGNALMLGGLGLVALKLLPLLAI